MNYREKIRKAIECPQLGNETYGEWGILNLTQRKYIKRLLDDLDNDDNFVKKLYFENKQLKDNWNYIKKMLKEVRQEKFNVNGYCGTCTDVDIDFLLNKMQEMEKNYGNVEDNT